MKKEKSRKTAGKSKTAIIAELFGSSFLPGKTSPAIATAVDSKEMSNEGQVKQELAAKISHLGPAAQKDILELSDIMAYHPIRPWVSEDGMDAGVWASQLVQEQAWDLLGRFKKIFFGVHHEVICKTFADGLVVSWRRYAMQKNIVWRTDRVEESAQEEK